MVPFAEVQRNIIYDVGNVTSLVSVQSQTKRTKKVRWIWKCIKIIS